MTLHTNRQWNHLTSSIIQESSNAAYAAGYAAHAAGAAQAIGAVP